MLKRQSIKEALLKGLLRADDTPMPDAALVAVGLLCHPTPPRSEVESVLREMEEAGFISGSDGFTGRSWTLTVKGKHQAQQL